MNYFVSYLLLWTLPSGVSLLGIGMVATPLGILRLTGRLVGVRVKEDLFVTYGVLTSPRTSIEYFRVNCQF